MNNKQTGILLMGFAGILFLVIILFNNALKEIVNVSCSHGPSCPMWGSINFYTNLTIAMTIIILLIGLYFSFLKDYLKEKTNKENEENKQTKIEIPKNLNPDEKQVMQIIIEEQGTIFQSTLVEKTNLNKVKMTRILDKLEGKNLIERKRRGMTNVVILKHEKT